MGFFDFLTQEIAIDLGTANTLIIHNDKLVVDEPSIVAMDRTSGKVIALVNRPCKCTVKPTKISRQ
jgi:rod shape-determining protein MreB